MLNTVGSPVTEKNSDLRRANRDEAEDNVAWVARQAQDLIAQATSGGAGTSAPVADPTFILLLGGADRLSFRLRLAQAHLRNDLWPSHWSHTAFVVPESDFHSTGTDEPAHIDAGTAVYEVSLQPPGGFQTTVTTNGLDLVVVRDDASGERSTDADGPEDPDSVPQLRPRATLGQYADPGRFPNIALLMLNSSRSSWLKRRHMEVGGGDQRVLHSTFSVIESFSRQRGLIDLPEAMLVWLAFAWGAARTPNPLFDGHGIPSAIMVDAVLSAVGYDISPGIDSRLTCPETIWQSAKWWHLYYSGEPTMQTISGRYDVASKINENLLVRPQAQPTTDPSFLP